MQLLGDAADNPDQRIAEDINLFVERTLASQHRTAQRDRHARLVRGDPVDALRGRAALPVRRELLDSRLSGLGGAALRGGRDHADPSDRLAAGLAQFPSAAVRGRLPLQPRPGAGELRADRTARRRDRRARPAARSLRPRGRQLAPDHAAHQAADLSDRGLRAGIDDLSLHRDQPRLFCRHGPARRAHADGVGLQQRADGVVVFRHALSRNSRSGGR